MNKGKRFVHFFRLFNNFFSFVELIVFNGLFGRVFIGEGVHFELIARSVLQSLQIHFLITDWKIKSLDPAFDDVILLWVLFLGFYFLYRNFLFGVGIFFLIVDWMDEGNFEEGENIFETLVFAELFLFQTADDYFS